MGLFVAAWLAGEGIVVWRWAKQGAPPPPGALLWASAIFAALAVLADKPEARGLATAMAVGVDLAVLVQVLGKAPSGAAGWPPPVMAAPTTQVFPGGTAAAAAAPAAADPRSRFIISTGPQLAG
jgi:hypothetical protein